MASITSLSNAATSIYGTRNVISGLATGMDTESMIENAVSGLKMKITNLNKGRTKVEWQQDAYRSIISKLSNFSTKYTSYTSSTNLMSANFFSNAATLTSRGENASKVTATGKSSSDVKVLGVKQLATAASYTLSNSGVLSGAGEKATATGKEFSLSGETTVGTLEGTMNLKYGNKSISIEFNKGEKFNNAQELADAINEKLADEEVTVGSTTGPASDLIEATVGDDGGIVMREKTDNGNGAFVESVTGTLGNVLTLNDPAVEDGDPTGFAITGALTEQKTNSEQLDETRLTITLDGVSKSFDVPTKAEREAYVAQHGGNEEQAFVSLLQQKVDDKFGAGKLEISDATEGDGISLQFAATQKGSTIKVAADKSDVMGLGSAGITSYLDTGRTLGDLMPDRFTEGSGEQELVLNGVTIGKYTKDTAIETIINDINANTEAGVKVSYSKTTNQMIFTAKETGEAGGVEFGAGLGQDLFGGGVSKKGQDAVLTLEVNGQRLDNIERSSNSFEVDGINLNLKGTFGYEDTRVQVADGIYEASGSVYFNGKTYNLVNEDGRVVDENGEIISNSIVITSGFKHVDAEGNDITDQPEKHKLGTLAPNAAAGAVTFETGVDSKKIIDAVKSMITDYNAMASEIKKAYSTMPEQTSKGKEYEPLTDEDKEGMSETSIKNHEDKAKAGLLFADNDLRTLYTSLTNALSTKGLSDIGITQSYSDGLTTLSLDEEKLRTALESDPDKVASVFTRTDETSPDGDGLMQALKNPVDKYGKTSGTKGILVEKAGSPLAATSLYNNDLYRELSQIEDDIEKVESQISDKIDYYTKKFTALETMVAQMNNQSSMLMGLSSGG